MTSAPVPVPHALDANASDPVTMGWMIGAPPPADKLIRFADGSWFRFPQTRWSFSNIRQLLPTRVVGRGDGSVSALPRAERNDIDEVTFQPLGRTDLMTWGQSLAANYTDGILDPASRAHRLRALLRRPGRRPAAHRVFGDEVVRRHCRGGAHP